MRVLLILLSLVLLSCSSDEPKPLTLEGTWLIESTVVTGQATIESVNGQMTVTSGYYSFVDSPDVKYSVLLSVPITESYIELFNEVDSKLVLRHPLVSNDYLSITCDAVEYDTKTGPTVFKKVDVTLTRL